MGRGAEEGREAFEIGLLPIGERVVVALSTIKPQSEESARDAAGDPVETKGFLIELTHEGTTYQYHTDMSRARFCE